MNEAKELSQEETDKIVIHIVKKVYKKMHNEINSQIEILCKKYKNIQSKDFIDICLRSLISLDISIMTKLIKDHKVLTGNSLDIEKLFQSYIQNLHELIIEEKNRMIKEIMN